MGSSQGNFRTLRTLAVLYGSGESDIETKASSGSGCVMSTLT